METLATRPTFFPLVAACKAYGIGKTTAHKLAANGDLQTFLLGSKRMVIIASLDALASRLSSEDREGQSRE